LTRDSSFLAFLKNIKIKKNYIMRYSSFSLYSFCEEMQFSYARVFAEKGKENNGRTDVRITKEIFFFSKSPPSL